MFITHEFIYSRVPVYYKKKVNFKFVKEETRIVFIFKKCDKSLDEGKTNSVKIRGILV